MAEIIETKTAQYQYDIHKITCDKCGKHICDSEEYDDGYYDDPGEYEQKFTLKKMFINCLCNYVKIVKEKLQNY